MTDAFVKPLTKSMLPSVKVIFPPDAGRGTKLAKEGPHKEKVPKRNPPGNITRPNPM
jgi:hypothetical protein